MKKKQDQSEKGFKLNFTASRSQGVQASPAFLRLSRGCDGRRSSSHNTPSGVCSQLSRPGRNLPSPPSLWEHMCLCPSLRPKSSRAFFSSFLSLFSNLLTSLQIVNVVLRSLPFSLPPSNLPPSLPQTSPIPLCPCQKSSSASHFCFVASLHPRAAAAKSAVTQSCTQTGSPLVHSSSSSSDGATWKSGGEEKWWS